MLNKFWFPSIIYISLKIFNVSEIQLSVNKVIGLTRHMIIFLLACPYGWDRGPNYKCYKFIRRSQTWYSALVYCRRIGSMLAEPRYITIIRYNLVNFSDSKCSVQNQQIQPNFLGGFKECLVYFVLLTCYTGLFSKKQKLE